MAGTAELREALFELDQYLSDRLAPLMVADSVAMLIRFPAQVLASEIGAWADRQRSGVNDASVADFLFHAVKKISLIGEFDLVPKEALAKYLLDLCSAVLEYCPEISRELLRQNLERLGHAPANPFAAPLEVLHRLSETETVLSRVKSQDGGQALSRDVALGLRRLSLLLERLQLQSLVSDPLDMRAEVASQFMTAAAVQSSSQKELDEFLAPLAQVGIETTVDKVLRALAKNVPGWGKLPPGASGAAESPRGPLKAMHQIVSLAEDPAEGGKRFRELVHAAIEEFNGGHLGRSVTMFELAEQLVNEEKVKPAFVDALKNGGHEFLNADKLRQLAERPDCRASLEAVLRFFVALQPKGLLKALDGEPRRERRHELLALLEVHGSDARAQAYEMLLTSVEDPDARVDPFFQMNLVYLLRVISAEGAPVEDEINLVMRVPGRASPPPLVKQVIAYLAQIRHEKSERGLIAYLRLFENMLLQPETAVYQPEDIDVLLERTCAALARHGAPRAWRALVDHGLKTEARLGSAMARLVEAGRQDLSGSKDLVSRLLEALRAELPRVVLGITVKKVNEERIVWLIRALSGTPLPEVRELLQEIVDKHSGQSFADAAAKGLAALTAAGKPEIPAGISGDLDLFGLPGLLQTLGQQQLTGILNLLNGEGKPQATLLFERGRIRGAQVGSIRGEDAAYQLFEKPFPGTFAFVSRTDIASLGALSEPLDVLGVILEGVRRHDEFKRAAALVPDRVNLKPTGTPSTPLSDEDAEFVHVVWAKAAASSTPVECEASIATDAYRVRRLLAHWIEEGSLAAG